MSVFPFRVAFLDQDHVLGVAHELLSSPSPAGDRRLRDFFSPEEVDPPVLRRLGGKAVAPAGIELVGPDPCESDLAGANAFVYRRGEVGREMLAAAPDLRLIQRLGGSTAGIDLAAVAAAGVEVSCLPRRTLAYAAEHALMLMLVLAKRLRAAERSVASWDGAIGEPAAVSYNWPGLDGLGGLEGKTLGLVGIGEIGGLVGARARAFGMRVLYTARTRRAAELDRRDGVEFAPLEQLLASADFVSVHVPATPASRHLIGPEQLAAMRPGAFLVNTSRGSLVDEDALYEALRDGRIAGAGLDVHAREPRRADDRFVGLENVVLTPHVASGSRRNVLDEIKAILENIGDVRAGAVPRHARLAAG